VYKGRGLGKCAKELVRREGEKKNIKKYCGKGG